MTLEPGTEITLDAMGHQPLVVDEVLAGGMGVVAKLVREKVHGALALKTYQDVSDVERFHIEARAWAALSGHPNVAKLTWFGPWDGGWATVGHWYPTTLTKVDFSSDPMAGLEILREIAEGLAYSIEDRGVLHRDLKPANVLIDELGRPRITDFGLAAAIGSSEAADDLSGTPLYMAPELFDGAQPSIATEIYAFGVTAYEFVTRAEHPYLGADTGFRLLPRFRKRPLDALARDVAFLRVLLPQLVALDPSERPSSFSEVLNALGRERRGWKRTAIDVATESGVLLMQDRIGDAAELVSQALVGDPKNPALLLANHWILLLEGRYEEASAALESACRSVVASYGALENRIYIDPLAVSASEEIQRGALTRAASTLRQARNWTSAGHRRSFPEFGWLALYEGRPDEALFHLMNCTRGLDQPALAYSAVAVARSEDRQQDALQFMQRMRGRIHSRHVAVAAALLETWMPPHAREIVLIPPAWASDLGSLLGSEVVIPLNPVLESALLGALESELVEGFDPEGQEWAEAKMHRERGTNLFQIVATRFQQLYPEGSRLHRDLVFALERLLRVQGYSFDPSDPRVKELVGLAQAGYVWRLAEGPSDAAAKRWMAETTLSTFDPQRSRSDSIGQAAVRCIAEGIPLGLASPGWLSHGRDIFEASYRNAVALFGQPESDASDDERFHTYNFGVALCDVEPIVDAQLDPAIKAREV